MVVVDLSMKSLRQLETMSFNFQRLNRIAEPRYAEVQAEIARRKSGNFDLEKTIAAIIVKARVSQFIGYKEIAEASVLEWTRCHWSVGPHLVTVCNYAHEKGWPLITAVVVNQDKVLTGEMKPENIAGFIEAARLAGRNVDLDEVSFIKREQQRVFHWARWEIHR